VDGPWHEDDTTTVERRADDAAVRALSVADLVARRLDPDDPWRLALVQRHAVWDEVRMARLLDSLLAGYPIGSVLVCRVRKGSHVLIERDGTRIAEEAPEGTWQLVDGQQRINALVAIFTGLGGFGRFYLDLTVRRDPEDVVTRRRAKRAALRHIVWRADDEPDADGTIPNRERFLDLSRWSAWAAPASVERLRRAADAMGADRRELVEILNEIDPAFADDLAPAQLSTATENARRLVRIWTQQAIPVQRLTLDGPIDVLQVFSRINLEGVRLDGEDVFFAAVKTLWNEAEENLDRVAGATSVLNRLTALRLLARLASRAVRRDDLLPLRVDALNGTRGEQIIRAMARLAADGSEPLGRIGLLGRLLTAESGLGYGLREVDGALLDHVFGWVAVHPQGTDEAYLSSQLPEIDAYLLGATAFRYPTVFRDTFARVGFAQAIDAGTAGDGFPLGGILRATRTQWPRFTSGQRSVRADVDEAGHLDLVDANGALFLSIAQQLPYELPVRDGGPARRVVEWDHIYPQALAKNMRIRDAKTQYLVHHPDRRHVWSAGNLWALDRPINNKASDAPPSKKFELLERLPDATRDLPSRWPSAAATFLTPAERELVLAAERAIELGQVDEGMEAFRTFARARGLRLYEAVVSRYKPVQQFASRADHAISGAERARDEAHGVAPLDVAAALGLDEVEVDERIELVGVTQPGDAPDTFGPLLDLARRRGLDGAVRKIAETARLLGLYPRPYKTSLMVAPPSHHGRMLFTVWPQDGESFTIYRWAAALAQFFPWIDINAASTLGPDGYGSLPANEVDAFLDRLRSLFADHVPELRSVAFAPTLSGDEIRKAALEYLMEQDPDRRGIHYYDITHAVERVGRVGGKNTVATVQGSISSRGDLFTRVAPGTYTWRAAADAQVGEDGTGVSSTEGIE
jgi:hypothetical protein